MWKELLCIFSVQSVFITFYSLFFVQGIPVLDLHIFQIFSFSLAVWYNLLCGVSVLCKPSTISTQYNTNASQRWAYFVPWMY